MSMITCLATFKMPRCLKKCGRTWGKSSPQTRLPARVEQHSAKGHVCVWLHRQDKEYLWPAWPHQHKVDEAEMVQVYLGSLAKQPWREKILLRSPTFNQYSYWLKRATLEQTTRIRKNKCFSRTRREAEDEVRAKEVVLAKAKEEASIGITKMTQNFSKKNTMSVSGSASTLHQIKSRPTRSGSANWVRLIGLTSWRQEMKLHIPFGTSTTFHSTKMEKNIASRTSNTLSGYYASAWENEAGPPGSCTKEQERKGKEREPATCEQRYTGTRPSDT